MSADAWDQPARDAAAEALISAIADLPQPTGTHAVMVALVRCLAETDGALLERLAQRLEEDGVI
jgi:hypothetical protein